MSKHSLSWLNKLAFAPGSTEFTNRQLITMLKESEGEHFELDDNIKFEMWDRELTYIKNFFLMECEDKKFKRAFDWVIYNLYMFGMCAIGKVDDNYVVYQMSDYQENLSHEIISAKLVCVVNGKEQTLEYEKEDKSIIILKANFWNKPWWFFSQRYYDEYIESLQCLSTNRRNSTHTKAFMTRMPGKDKKEELKYAQDPKTSFIMINEQYDIQDLSVNNEVDKSWNDVMNVIKMWEKFRGIRHNLSRKDGERNLTGELENDSVQFSFIEMDKLKIFNYLCEEAKTKWGLNAKIVTLIDIEEAKENKKEPEEKEDGSI